MVAMMFEIVPYSCKYFDMTFKFCFAREHGFHVTIYVSDRLVLVLEDVRLVVRSGLVCFRAASACFGAH